eukprot:428872-Prorocentrum_minimum.AAC.2
MSIDDSPVALMFPPAQQSLPEGVRRERCNKEPLVESLLGVRLSLKGGRPRIAPAPFGPAGFFPAAPASLSVPRNVASARCPLALSQVAPLVPTTPF